MNGILLIDKPSGWTSNDVVIKLKGILHQRRVGHSGTLDPMATGLLVVFAGRATRAVEFAEAHSKRYIARLSLGIVTDTQDITGNILSRSEADISEEKFIEAIKSFEGPQEQLPPMYSAIKVNGKKLYDIARKGGEVERKKRSIEISRLEYLGREGEEYILDVSCSKGTYIRTLCHDIGQKLGCGACMTYLRRVEAGEFSVDNAVTIEYVQRAADEGRAGELLMPEDRLFASYPEYAASDTETQRIKCGNEIRSGLTDGKYRVYSAKGEFLMLGQVSDGIMRTVKSFFEVEVK